MTKKNLSFLAVRYLLSPQFVDSVSSFQKGKLPTNTKAVFKIRIQCRGFIFKLGLK